MWNVGSLCGKGGEVGEALKDRMIDVCCMQELIWRGPGFRMLMMVEGGFNLWRFVNGVGAVGVIMKEVLCKMVVRVRMVSDGVMAVVLVF